jgi:hypothetical protein
MMRGFTEEGGGGALKGINEEAAAHEQAILYREEKEVEESAFSVAC